LLSRAAADVFREEGADAPLDLVARRAGLGRGTLYRHFPDRGFLLAALLEERLATLESFAASYPGDDLVERLLVEICGLLEEVPGLMTAAGAYTSSRERLEAVTKRTEELLAASLDRAKRAGTIRAEVVLDDLLVTFAMFDGVIVAGTARPLAGFPHRALALTLRALRTPARADEPVPERTIPFPVPAQELAD